MKSTACCISKIFSRLKQTAVVVKQHSTHTGSWESWECCELWEWFVWLRIAERYFAVGQLNIYNTTGSARTHTSTSGMLKNFLTFLSYCCNKSSLGIGRLIWKSSLIYVCLFNKDYEEADATSKHASNFHLIWKNNRMTSEQTVSQTPDKFGLFIILCLKSFSLYAGVSWEHYFQLPALYSLGGWLGVSISVMAWDAQCMISDDEKKV